ncbi:Kdo hydroxylase family protein [Neisseriaceae bacterium TC5R-5]|nr:Kdo hydroxylase family protein [Neisseriaceae bacterium TC5R-5]
MASNEVVTIDPLTAVRCVNELEQGKVLYLPRVDFALSSAEQQLLDPVMADPRRKNISLNPETGHLQGVL